MNEYKLPIEMYEKIFSFVLNTDTLLSIRLSCKLFYLLNKNIKIYENNKLLYVYKFNENFIKQNFLTITNPKNNIIGYVNFDYNGYTKILNDMKINVCNNTVFFRDYKYNYFLSRFYDIITKKTEENIINAMCSIS
tara:strand:- start:214 stop:621 length:408 start_codon:yes stop_codon:yes gene_type:complete